MKRFAVCFLSMILLSAFAVGQESSFELRAIDAETVALFDGQSPVWEYVFAQKTNDAVPTDDPRRVAASFFHPLFGLDGKPITVSATLDDNHAHHHGLWSSFTTVILHRADGTDETYDTWTDNTAMKKNFIRWPSDKRLVADAQCCSMTVENGWFINDREKIMDETLAVTTGAVCDDAELGRYRILDFAWTWRPVGDSVTLAGDRAAQKNFSSLAIRFVRPVSKPMILSENGEIVGDEMLGATPWLDYRSTDDERPFAVAIFPNPDNPPAPRFGMAIRHYGLIAAGWPGLEGVTLTKETPMKVGYRVIIHEKSWTIEQLQAIYKTYQEQ